MFTGIIEALGTVADARMQGGDLRLRIKTGSLDLADVKLGDSIAVNGVCLTAVELPGDGFWADVSRETLAHTKFEQFRTGDRVNLEKALTPTSRLGGHIVSGHVDGFGTIADKQDDGRSIRFRIKAPQNLARYIAPKGSICVDGVSLTVNAVEGALFELNIVPHTLEETLIKYYSVGQNVNLEVDLIARYLERLLQPSQQGEHSDDRHSSSDDSNSSKAGNLTETFLAQHGFIGRR
ncbi:riboflavin synthase [Motiliproteus sp. MSK22-1]|uniref:riboflavin synthase n=1 Tax=Motiliproteus sp. MSK22-1 TaxID=1897630 RepID=UPI0009767BB5|nr:riboflavin synthase [Motiliproteus sp. MSK22-1]OMH39364.1 riboflavin synthase subunit alpha [Motiliproteus sp. MSK22-1]